MWEIQPTVIKLGKGGQADIHGHNALNARNTDGHLGGERRGINIMFPSCAKPVSIKHLNIPQKPKKG